MFRSLVVARFCESEMLDVSEGTAKAYTQPQGSTKDSRTVVAETQWAMRLFLLAVPDVSFRYEVDHNSEETTATPLAIDRGLEEAFRELSRSRQSGEVRELSVGRRCL